MQKERERMICVSIYLMHRGKIQNTCLVPHVDFHSPVPDFLRTIQGFFVQL